MPRPAPTYVPVEFIAAEPIAHHWDDWDPYVVFGEPDERVVDALRGVSLKGVLAFALASTEWILYRMKNHSADSLPWEYVDAKWASLVKWKLAFVWEPGRENKDGPVRGPIDVAIRQITNCHRALKLAEGEIDAAVIDRVAQFVLPDPSPYLAWRREALNRLYTLYPRDVYGFGPATPREALDPTVQMTAESGVALAEAYVRSLDFNTNEFLNPSALTENSLHP